jgi:hypothetical protein
MNEKKKLSLLLLSQTEYKSRERRTAFSESKPRAEM